MVAKVVEKARALPDNSIRIMLRMLEQEGMDTKAPLRAAGLPLGLPTLPGSVTAAQEFAFQAAFVEVTGYRPDIWVRTGGSYHLPSFGQLGLALITSSTLDDYMNTSADTRDLDYSMATVTALTSQGPTMVGYSIDVSGVPEPLREFTLYRDLGAIVTTLGDLWGSPFPLSSIRIALPQPLDPGFTILDAPAIFGASENAVAWSRDLNTRPLHYGDPELHAAYLESCRQGSPERGTRSSFITILQEFIEQGLGDQLSLAMLSGELGTTERTLQRRLKARELGFRDLVDEARRGLATDMLDESDMSVAEIAFRLGYSDAISFSQAFRRWTGSTPAAMRRQHQLRGAEDGGHKVRATSQ